MTVEQRQALEQEIATGLNTASTVASFLGPQGALFALIGKAVAAVEPTLVEDVATLFSKSAQGDPTDAEEKALADKITALFSPETV